MSRKTTLRLLTVVGFILSALWMIFEPGFEPIVGFITSAIPGLLSLWDEGKSEKRDTSAEDANIRRDLLKAVGDEFISRLEQMLTDDIRAELRLDYTPEAVQHREWLNKTGLPDELSADADIVTIFEKAQRKLLIIGEPGAGKTTALVRLGAQLIEQARNDDNLPVPVLFELSRWKSGQTMRDWLAAELKDKYALTVERWMEWLNPAYPRILPLLDGFDEVAENVREECAEAINVFAHDLTLKLSVCCRVKEYSLLQTKLEKVNALQIEELGEAQINRYLEVMGLDTVGLRATLMYDTDLLDMAKSPLLLNTLIMAYRGEGEVIDFENATTDDERRKALFAGYVKKRLKNKEQLFPEQFRYAKKFKVMNPMRRWFVKHFRSAEIEYNDEETRHWLGWLAWQMEKHKRMQVFAIESLKPDWLIIVQQQKQYHRFERVALGVIGGVIIGVIEGVVGGIIGGVIGGVVEDAAFGVVLGIAFGVVLGIAFGVVLGIAFGTGKGELIEPIERLQWSTRAALSKWRTNIAQGMAQGMAQSVGLGVGLGVALGVALGTAQGVVLGVALGVAQGIVLGVALGVAGIFNDGLVAENLVSKTRPNEGIYQSLKNTARFSLLYGLLFSMAIGMVVGVSIGVVGGTAVGVVGGAIGTITVGVAVGVYWSILFQGGVPFLRHVALREVLWRSGYAPYNYAHFLDYCVRLRLLVRVGGSYKFMHRLLQEHFAAEYEAAQAKNE